MIQKVYPLTVVKKIPEGENSCTLVFEPRQEDKDVFIYKPAQFLSFHLNIQGEKVIRSYSLSSSPLLNEPLTTSIKKVEGGAASSYLLDHIQEGSIIESARPMGKFFKTPASLKPRHYFIIAGGSGITPLFSIIKTALAMDEKNHITLIYCNRKQSEIIYKEPIEKLKNLHAGRFQVVQFLSRPEEGDAFDFKGRLDPARLQNLFNEKKLNLETEYYLCGPKEMMKMAKDLFMKNQVDRKEIRMESFGSPQKTPSMDFSKIPESAVVIQAKEENAVGKPKTIKALLEGEKIEIPAKTGIPILEQLIDEGFCPPFSCMAGSCMTCMAVLKKGRVYQDEAGILDEDNIANKEILTCQAKALSPLVEVDYDS